MLPGLEPLNLFYPFLGLSSWNYSLPIHVYRIEPLGRCELGNNYRVLLISESKSIAKTVAEMLTDVSPDALTFEHRKSLAQARRSLKSGDVQVVILDGSNSKPSLEETVEQVLAISDMPLVVIGPDEKQVALNCLRAGAGDYIPLDELSPSLLMRSVEFAVARSKRVQACETGGDEAQDSGSSLSVRELMDMIEVAAHQLRHPATVIKGYLTLLRDYGGSIDEETRNEAVSGIEEASTRLTSLINTLLDTTRIDRKQMRISRKPTMPKSLVLRVTSEMRARGAEVPINLLYAGTTDYIDVDPEKIKDVLSILVDNAVKFTPPGEGVDIWVEDESSEVIFNVADRGPGVPEEDREKVFDRFYRVEGKPYDSKPGIGLGLFIAKNYIEAHGGWIKVEPRDGGGAIFSFGIPITPKEWGDDEEPLEKLLRRFES